MSSVDRHSAQNVDLEPGRYLIDHRADLRDWHYDHEGRRAGCPDPHSGFVDGSPAWTHCTCFGAAWRAAEPLLAEVERLRAAIEDHRDDEKHRHMAYKAGSMESIADERLWSVLDAEGPA